MFFWKWERISGNLPPFVPAITTLVSEQFHTHYSLAHLATTAEVEHCDANDSNLLVRLGLPGRRDTSGILALGSAKSTINSLCP